MTFAIRAFCTLLPLLMTAQEPFYGTPLEIPGTIQAEDFDRGAPGEAYHFAASHMVVNDYRLERTPIVSVTAHGESGVVVDLGTDEWIQFTVDVSTAGAYALSLREREIECTHFELEVNGEVIQRVLGCWNQVWNEDQPWVEATVAQWIPLKAGRQTLRIRMIGVGISLDWLRFDPDRGPSPVRMIGTVAPGFADGAEPSFSAALTGLDFDTEGNLYVADAGNYRIRKIQPNGFTETMAGTGESGYVDGPGDIAKFVELVGQRSLAVDSLGSVYVMDHDRANGVCRFRRIDPDGYVQTVHERALDTYTTFRWLSLNSLDEWRYVEARGGGWDSGPDYSVWSRSTDGQEGLLSRYHSHRYGWPGYMVDMTAGHSPYRAVVRSVSDGWGSTFHGELLTGGSTNILDALSSAGDIDGLAMDRAGNIAWSSQYIGLRSTPFGETEGKLLSRIRMRPLVMDDAGNIFGTGLGGQSSQIVRVGGSPGYILSSHAPVPGGGTVVLSQPGHFEPGTIVQISAAPLPGWSFFGWRGDVLSTNAELSVLMDDHKLINPEFGTRITASSDASRGVVQRNPDLDHYAYADRVTFTAHPQSGFRFRSWSDGQTNPIRTVAVTGPVELIAQFDALPGYTVNAEALGGNGGTVERFPDQPSYFEQTLIELIARPAAGYYFQTWLDGVQDNPRELVVSSNTNLFAVFAPGATMEPLIASGITNQTTWVGATVSFGVRATGGTPLEYQWLKDGDLLQGETKSALILASAEREDAGSYEVRVHNPSGMETSTATLVVLDDVPHLSVAAAGDGIRLTLEGRDEGIYRIEYSDDLEHWSWITVATTPDGTWSATDPLLPFVSRYYRAVVGP